MSLLSALALLSFGSCRRHRENNRLNLSLFSEDEVDNLLCLGFIKGEVPADGFCIRDGPSHVDLLVVAYHRNWDDMGSVILRIGVGLAAKKL